jgi:hypothetical protein
MMLFARWKHIASNNKASLNNISQCLDLGAKTTLGKKGDAQKYIISTLGWLHIEGREANFIFEHLPKPSIIKSNDMAPEVSKINEVLANINYKKPLASPMPCHHFFCHIRYLNLEPNLKNKLTKQLWTASFLLL